MSCDSQIKYKDKKNTKKKKQQSNKSINVTYLFLNIYFYIDSICFIFIFISRRGLCTGDFTQGTAHSTHGPTNTLAQHVSD
jgi:hypothetical protein